MAEKVSCKVCLKSFNKGTDLLKHLKTYVTLSEIGNMQNEENQENDNQHEVKQNVACEICDRTFVSYVRLRNHVKNVHDEGNLHKCEPCGKTFSLKGSLNILSIQM